MRRLVFSLGLILFATGMQLNAGTIYTATLTGGSEVPPTGSPATGNALLTLNGNLLQVSVNYSGLIGGASSASHIHCCTAPGTNTGVAVPFVGFPSAASGSYSNTFDLTLAATYQAAFLTANGGAAATAEAALLAGMNAGMAYVNIHDAEFPGGEIRGFAQLAPGGGAAAVPETGSIVLLSLGLIALAFVRQFQRFFSA